jgi:aryl-alcohol dehydrogenase-like predicted oxidoreductase
MKYRTLGRTGLRISAIAFGAGPVSGLMTGDDYASQVATLRRAVERGINWIDTAPGYGQGASETNVGRALREIGARDEVHVATKVRLTPDDFADIRVAVRQSVEESLARLGRNRITLLQLHNGLTARRDDEPFSICPADVLQPGGVLEAFREVQAAGLVRFVGLTGTGHPMAVRAVVRTGEFDTIQVPYNLLNQSAGYDAPADFRETNYGNIIADSSVMEIGVFSIRVFAGGALLDQPPSAHTLITPFFPLAQYERDRERARELAGAGSLKEAAIQFVLDDERVHAAIVGFGSPDQVDEVCDLIERETPGHGPAVR